MTKNSFATYATGMDSPAVALVAVVKSDATDLPAGICRALLVGVGGSATIIDASGNTLTNVPLQQGYNPIGVGRVLTGGSADNIWALY